MEATDVNMVLDKLAEKLGVAVEVLKPGLETLAREYAAFHTVFAWSCVAGIAFVLAIAGCILLATFRNSDDGTVQGGRVGAVIVGGVGTLLLGVGVVHNFACAAAPTLGVLRILLGDQ